MITRITFFASVFFLLIAISCKRITDPSSSPPLRGSSGFGEGNVPQPNTDYVAIAGGGVLSFGLREDGSISAWGRNLYGTCDVPAPNTSFSAVDGSEHGMGLREDGSIVTWGSNGHGQCNVPEPNTGFTDFDGGHYFSMGLKENGVIVVWGTDETGSGFLTDIPEPDSTIVAIAAGDHHCLCLRAP